MTNQEILSYMVAKWGIRIQRKSKKKFEILKRFLIDFLKNENLENYLPLDKKKKLIIKLNEIFIDEAESILNFLVNKYKDVYIIFASILFLELKEYILKQRKIETENFIKNLGIKNLNEISEEEALTAKMDAIYSLLTYIPRVEGISIFFDDIRIKNFFEEISDIESSILNTAVNFIREYRKVLSLILVESIKQSDISNAGSSYEERVKKLILKCGIPKTNIISHERENEKERDYVIKFNDKEIKIGVKRTLRERYKQHENGIIVFTLGIDLNEEKAKIITEEKNSIIFVADDIYNSTSFLKENPKVKKVSDFCSFLKSKLA